MILTANDLQNVARLAKIAITEADLETYASDLSKLLTLIEQMEKVDTKNITPMAHPLDGAQYLRSDDVTENNLPKDIASYAPQSFDNFFLVPSVIE